MIRALSIAALLLVAGCTQQDPVPSPANEEASAPTPIAADSVPALDGQWSVTAIDGRPVGADSAMTAKFEGGKASISSGCFRRAWTYTQKRNVVAFAADPGGSANCGGQPPSAIQESADAVLTGSNIAIFGEDGNEASLSGIGGGLTLERR